MANIYKSFLGKSMGLLGVAMLMLCFSNTSFAQLSGNLTVDKNAAASATNFTSFQALFTALSAQGVNGAVTVDVSNGPYVEQVRAAAITGTSATNTVTVNGNNEVLEFTATASGARHTFWFDGADYVTLKDLTIRGLGTTYGWGIRLRNRSEHITIDACTVEIPNVTSTGTSNSACIAATNSATNLFSASANVRYLTIKDCMLTGGATTRGPNYGIVIYAQSSDATPSFTKIHNNKIKNWRNYGIRNERGNDIEIFDNELYRDPNYSRITTTYPIYFGRCRITKVRRNNIHHLFPVSSTSLFRGIYYNFNSSTVGSHDVTNNLIYDNNTRGSWYGIYNSCTRNIDMRYNTIVHNQVTPQFGTQTGCYVQCSYGGRSFENNIVVLDMPGTSTRYGIEHRSTTMSIDNNDIYVTGTNGNYANRNGAAEKTLADWQAVTGGGAPFGANSVDVDPNFISSTTAAGLSPRAIAVDDIGQPFGTVTTDYGNNMRDAVNPDPGAWEFKVDAAVTALTTPGGNLSCQGETDEVEIVITNNATFAISGFSVTYTATGTNAKTVTEPYVGSIAAGMTGTFKFAEKLEFTNTGNTDVTATIGNKPAFGPYSINTNPSPIGAEFAKGSTYTGNFLTGNRTDPDITANPDEVVYVLNPPTGFNNSDYGVTWNISTYEANSAKGVVLKGTPQVVRTNPVGANGLTISVKPNAALTDDTVIINIAAFSIATQCEAPVLDRYIFVAPRPTADFNSLDVCEGDAVQFVNTSAVSTGTIGYKWEFGDGTESDFADFSKTYNGFGTYSVKLTVESNYGYTDVITKTVEVFEAPKVEFGFTNKCEGDAVPFIDNSTVPGGSPTYSWNFGDGNSSTAASPTHTYTNVDVYDVSLTITDARACSSTETKKVTYSKNPTADFSIPALVCNQNDVMFTNTSIPSGNTGYVWDFGNSSTSQSKDGSTIYTAAGTFTVSLTARNDFGCDDVRTQTLTITEAPVADFTTPGGCTGDQLMFTNTTSEPAGAATTYEWSFGEDGATSTSKDDSYTYNSVGDYEVILKAESDNGCGTEKTVTITLGERPIVDFTLPEKACEGQDVFITNSSVVSSGSLTNSWNLGNGTNSSANNPTANYATAGNYTVMLESESGTGCKASKSRSITINAIPNSDFTFESAKTGDGRMRFTPISPNGTGDYKWIYGDGSTSTETGVHNFVYTSPVGLFKVTLIINNDGCLSRTTKDVSINVLSVSDVIKGKLKVYPNPTSGNVSVDIDNVNTISKLQVVDMLGKVIAQQPANAATTIYNFDLTAQSAGIYFVQIHTDSGVFSKKITISK